VLGFADPFGPTWLRDALAVYRLAFGQARQEDVIDHLVERLGPQRAAPAG
jgi:hypothetical protein